MARKLLGFVLIHPEKEDFVVGSNNNEMMNIVAYGGHPEQAKIFKDFEEIKDFVSYLILLLISPNYLMQIIDMKLNMKHQFQVIQLIKALVND